MRNYTLLGIVSIAGLALVVGVLKANNESKKISPIIQGQHLIIACEPYPYCIVFPDNPPGDDDKFFQLIDEHEEVGIKPLQQEEKG